MAMYFDGSIGFQLNTGSSSGEITVTANTFDLPNRSDFYFVLIRNNNVESINHISYDNASTTSVTMQLNDTLLVFGKTANMVYTNVFYVNYGSSISVFYMVKSTNNNNCVWSRESYTTGLKNYTTNLTSNSLTASPESLTVRGGTIHYNNSDYTSGNIILVANERGISSSGGLTSLNLLNTRWGDNIKINYNGTDYTGGQTIPLVSNKSILTPKVDVDVHISQNNSATNMIVTNSNTLEEYDITESGMSYNITSNDSLNNLYFGVKSDVNIKVENMGDISSKASFNTLDNGPTTYYDLPHTFNSNNKESNIYVDNTAPEITIDYEGTTPPIISNT
jgi:hypothetical protein